MASLTGLESKRSRAVIDRCGQVVPWLVFAPGAVSVTETAWTLLERNGSNAIDLVRRHCAAEWPVMDVETRKKNIAALRDNQRIVSTHVVGGEPVMVITEGDRSITLVLLPDELCAGE